MDAGPIPKRGSLNRFDQNRLGRHLRSIYDGCPARPLPKRLSRLLARLEAAVTSRDHHLALAFGEDLVKALPNLRAFAISLSNNPDRANDLVQETIMRALNKRERFQVGTNLHAWLFTILRNTFYTEFRKRMREVPDSDGSFAASLTAAPTQIDKLNIQDLDAALMRLCAEQRKALLLVTAQGLSYEEAAAVCACAVGTVKSRVNRARHRLAELLGHSGLASLRPQT